MELEGTLVGGRYHLEERIGEGGMGSVWRATDQTLQRPVAVKVLYSGDERERELRVDRFLREARIAAAVQHRHVVHIIDFGSTDEGRPYMVMEHLEGETLADRLARSPAPTVGEVVDIVAMTLAGLAAAHDAGVVHRDMKPENVFLVDDPDGAYPKILDFGISRSLQPQSGPRSALTTREGFLVGTPQYMSPEQARGLEGIDGGTDLYSVGVILYEALAGRLPYEAAHIGDLIILIAGGGAMPLCGVRPELGDELSEVVQCAMSVDREARYADARAMRDALLKAKRASGEDVLALPARSRHRRSVPPPAATAEPAGPGQTVPLKPSAAQSDSASALAKTIPARRTPPVDSIETPRVWTVDGQEPPPRRRSGKTAWLVGGVLAVGAAVAVAVAGGGDGAASPAEHADPEPVPSAPATSSIRPAAQPDPAPEPPDVSSGTVPNETSDVANGTVPSATVDAGVGEPVRRARGRSERARQRRAARARAMGMAMEPSMRTPPATLRDLDY